MATVVGEKEAKARGKLKLVGMATVVGEKEAKARGKLKLVGMATVVGEKEAKARGKLKLVGMATVVGEKEAKANGNLVLMALGHAVTVMANTVVVFPLRRELAPLNSHHSLVQRRQSWIRKMNAGVVCFLASYSSPVASGSTVIFAVVDRCNHSSTSVSVKPCQCPRNRLRFLRLR
ncbi:hypothetical protein OPV22_009285 [Ensete ventricosum]|uniref:Uncharacterized protein n=1 Tax=Ensete ventricosum TaxID=4639 RepID=A0AAV8RIK8_ENSVE|nr:hypothetical protein OPV22_009285 [Ensete ventricosum]